MSRLEKAGARAQGAVAGTARAVDQHVTNTASGIVNGSFTMPDNPMSRLGAPGAREARPTRTEAERRAAITAGGCRGVPPPQASPPLAAVAAAEARERDRGRDTRQR